MNNIFRLLDLAPLGLDWSHSLHRCWVFFGVWDFIDFRISTDQCSIQLNSLVCSHFYYWISRPKLNRYLGSVTWFYGLFIFLEKSNMIYYYTFFPAVVAAAIWFLRSSTDGAEGRMCVWVCLYWENIW